MIRFADVVPAAKPTKADSAALEVQPAPEHAAVATAASKPAKAPRKPKKPA